MLIRTVSFRYGVGDSFKPHVDGGHVDRRPGPRLGESSVYTYVLYLNGKETPAAADAEPKNTKKEGISL